MKLIRKLLKKIRFSLRTLLIIPVIVAAVSWGVHDYFYVLHLTEIGHHKIIVDYAGTLDEKLADEIESANCEFIDSYFNSVRLPEDKEKSEKQELEAIIVNPNIPASYEIMFKALDERGLRMGTLRELMAFNDQCHKAYIGKYILATSPGCRLNNPDFRFVPTLGMWSGDIWGIGGFFWPDPWPYIMGSYDQRTCFLVFRK